MSISTVRSHDYFCYYHIGGIIYPCMLFICMIALMTGVLFESGLETNEPRGDDRHENHGVRTTNHLTT